ncbi:cytochrome p450 87a3 [Phtheirospermum japonicum]|uniref:Cytochrome p450 87a3 n=1 Tax=Phtheirospermum japonicum TaxID=374723 RepID=A0A830CM79_9LAMI|nr:cytochrome p450 87a3 [Phtheirospermum japonicum]
MWSFEVCVVVAMVSIYLTHWIYKWRNPKCNGILPPGSSGIPLAGETLQLLTPTYSHGVHPFIKKRLQRYGSLFRTNLAGRNVVVSADHEFNRFIFGQEEKLVVRWYLDSLSGLIKHGEHKPDGLTIHKYTRNLVVSHFGMDSIKQKLLSQFEDKVRKTLHSWSIQDSIELEYAFVLKREKVLEKIMEMVNDRLGSRQNAVDDDDLLGQMIKDMSNVNFVTKQYINNLMFTLMFATFQTVPFVTALAVKFIRPISPHHSNPANGGSETEGGDGTTVSWLGLGFGFRVPNRAAAVWGSFSLFGPGYTIPAGWVIMSCHTALHFDPEIYKDPLKFDPSRWKDVGPEFVSKNLKPFGGGIKQCAGADFTRVSMAIFFHVLVTKYRWTVVKGGEIVQTPMMRFKNGLHINLRRQGWWLKLAVVPDELAVAEFDGG